MNRRTFLLGAASCAAAESGLGFALADITSAANIHFRHHTGAFGAKYLPETLGSGCAFSTSALWFDYDRDGLLDLFVCNYVRWTPEKDVFCSLDGKNKSYCTPEAYRGSTCWLFRNRGDGTFEEVTAKSRIFDSTSKA